MKTTVVVKTVNFIVKKQQKQNYSINGINILNDNFEAYVKLRLHYNELAQRTATVWRYLTFGDIRCYTLKKSDECDH